MRLLTKSRFKLAVECPTKLFYTAKRDVYADRNEDDEFLKMLAEGGHQVGELAKQCFPDGREVLEKNALAAVSETLQLLKVDGDIVLFEPAIRFASFLVRVDILVRTGNRLEIIEVKATGYDPDKPGFVGLRGGISSAMLPYLQDAAFQTWVLRKAFPGTEVTTSLLMPNNAKVVEVDGLNQMFMLCEDSRVQVLRRNDVDLRQVADDLLERINIDEYVERILTQPLKYPGGEGSFDEVLAHFAGHYADDRRIDSPIGVQCGYCQFRADPGESLKSGFHECWKSATGWDDHSFPASTVLDLWNYRGKQSLIERGIYALDQVQPEDIGGTEITTGVDGLTREQRQLLQVQGIPTGLDSGGYFFDREYFRTKSGNWKYPLHMIDFETGASPLPFHAGRRPYEPVAFQFSHHTIEQDGSVRHRSQFLCATPGVFPNYEFVRVLKSALEGDEGTVFMWSNHEKVILEKILGQLSHDPAAPSDQEDLMSFLSGLIKDGEREIFDLRILAQKAYFHPATNGSNSIKDVLPAIIMASDKLRRDYAQPIYGIADGIPSLNDWGGEGYCWLAGDGPESAGDPYARLKELAESLLPSEGLTRIQRTSIIAEGAAAAIAYARLQCTTMSPEERALTENALKRYCELDTLAMVMIVQGWLDCMSCGKS
jgi:hypothetical protein